MNRNTVHLELINLSHADDVQRLANDSAIAATSNVPYPYPKDGARTWITSEMDKQKQGTSYAFAILNEEKDFVGVVTLMSVNQHNATAGLGYWIGRPYWGKGYGSSAAHRCISYAQEELGIKEIGASCLEHNTASRRILEKVGFKEVGNRKKHEQGIILAYQWISDNQD